jgi:phosphate/sulfate permease
MSKRLVQMFALFVLGGAVLASTSFAETIATVAVTPSITARGGKVFIHTAASNQTPGSQAVTVTFRRKLGPLLLD